MSNRYEVRGPLGDRRDAPGIPNQYRWAVWDRVNDCPVSHAATREWARAACEDFNNGDVIEPDGDDLDQLPAIINLLRGN